MCLFVGGGDGTHACFFVLQMSPQAPKYVDQNQPLKIWGGDFQASEGHMVKWMWPGQKIAHDHLILFIISLSEPSSPNQNSPKYILYAHQYDQ